MNDRRSFSFEIEIAACCITGLFTAESGFVTEIVLEDGTKYAAGDVLYPMITTSIKRLMASECLRQIEASHHYQMLVEQTAPREDMRAYAPALL